MRVSLSLPVAALGLVGSVAAYPHESKPVYRRDPDNQAKADAVKEAFQHAWDGYSKYAFPHDELHPVSNSYGDSRLARYAILVFIMLTTFQERMGCLCG